jgi:hypothetical protein
VTLCCAICVVSLCVCQSDPYFIFWLSDSTYPALRTAFQSSTITPHYSNGEATGRWGHGPLRFPLTREQLQRLRKGSDGLQLNCEVFDKDTLIDDHMCYCSVRLKYARSKSGAQSVALSCLDAQGKGAGAILIAFSFEIVHTEQKVSPQPQSHTPFRSFSLLLACAFLPPLCEFVC